MPQEFPKEIVPIFPSIEEVEADTEPELVTLAPEVVEEIPTPPEIQSREKSH